MKSLSDSKKLLIVSAATPTFEQYSALYALTTSLKEFSAKEVHIGVSNQISPKFKEALNLGNVKELTKLPPRKYLIEFPSQGDKVKGIQWNQEDDKLKFYVRMERGKFNSGNPKIETVGSDYETIIFVGVNNVSELGNIYSESKDVFKEANVISIGGKVEGEGFNVKQEFDNKSLTVAEDMYQFLIKNNMRVDGKIANALLAGIFFASNGMREDVNDAQTYMLMAELIKKGAKNSEANKIVDQIKSNSSQSKPNNSDSGNKESKDDKNKPNNTASYYQSSNNQNQQKNQNSDQKNNGQSSSQKSQNSNYYSQNGSNKQSNYQNSNTAPEKINF